MFIDTHAHLFDEKIDYCKLDLSSISKVLIPTYKMEQLNSVKAFCDTNPKYCLAVGVHPQYVSTFDADSFYAFVKNNLNDAKKYLYQSSYSAQSNSSGCMVFIVVILTAILLNIF